MSATSIIAVCITFALLALLGCAGRQPAGQDDDYHSQRQAMVDQQLIPRGIRGAAVLEVMRKVRRHDFVPPNLCAEAYSDNPLPIGAGQTISQPYIVALMTEVLEPDRTKKVLEIGTGSGYQAAILAELCDSVYTIEIVESLGARARQVLADAGYTNVHVRIGDGYQGWPEHAPFDAVIVTCAPSQVPAPLVEQLTEGGDMVVPVGDRGIQELVLLTKQDGQIVRKGIIPVIFVPMVDEAGQMY